MQQCPVLVPERSLARPASTKSPVGLLWDIQLSHHLPAVFSMHFQVTLLRRGWMHVKKVVYLGQEYGIAWKSKGATTERGSNDKMQTVFPVEISICGGEKIPARSCGCPLHWSLGHGTMITASGRCGMDFQAVGGLCSAVFPGWSIFPWLVSVVEGVLGCDGLKPGVRVMLRGLYPICPAAGREHCGGNGSLGPNPGFIFTPQPPCSCCATSPGSPSQCHLSPHPLPGLFSLPWSSVPYVPTSDCILLLFGVHINSCGSVGAQVASVGQEGSQSQEADTRNSAVSQCCWQ